MRALTQTICKENTKMTRILLSVAIVVTNVWNKKSCKGRVVVRHYTDKFVVTGDPD